MNRAEILKMKTLKDKGICFPLFFYTSLQRLQMKNEPLKKKGKQTLMLIQSPCLIFEKACGLLIHTRS